MAESVGYSNGKVPKVSLVNERPLYNAAKRISSAHVRRLATGHLGFSLAEVDNIRSNATGNSEDFIFQCLLSYCQRTPEYRDTLPEVLLTAGREEGLVRLAVVNILKGIKGSLRRGLLELFLKMFIFIILRIKLRLLDTYAAKSDPPCTFSLRGYPGAQKHYRAT